MKHVTLAVGVFILAPLAAGAQAPPGPPTDPAREAVMILRVVNTVQAQMRHPAGAFGSLSKVLASPMFKEQFNGASAVDSATATIGQRTLALVASDDQKHYQAMVVPTDKCGLTMFTNETGLIYSGRALGCDKQP
jgi:hypothetical protein